jgi:hypothetical protein
MAESQLVLGLTVKQEHIDAAVKTVLGSDEALLGAFAGQAFRDGRRVGTFAKQYLLVTSKRVIFWSRGVISNTTDAFNYRDISSVDAHRGLLLGDIEFNIKGAKEKWAAMQKRDVDAAAKLIRDLIDKANTTVPTTAAASIPVQIKQLSELKDAGILTQQEFEAKKKDLLSRM